MLFFMNVNQWTENDKAYYTWLVNIEPGGKMFTNNDTSLDSPAENTKN